MAVKPPSRCPRRKQPSRCPRRKQSIYRIYHGHVLWNIQCEKAKQPKTNKNKFSRRRAHMFIKTMVAARFEIRLEGDPPVWALWYRKGSQDIYDGQVRQARVWGSSQPYGRDGSCIGAFTVIEYRTTLYRCEGRPTKYTHLKLARGGQGG